MIQLLSAAGYALLMPLLYSGILLAVGIPAAWIVTDYLRVSLSSYCSKNASVLASSVVFYLLCGLLGVSVLSQLGFNVGVLMGAAGVFSIAVGFASQTSISNIISGLFLIIEQPFKIGDLIRVDSISGHVDSINLLSIGVRTTDGKYVRIPSELFLKTPVINVSKYGQCALNFNVRVAKAVDDTRVKQLIIKTLEQCTGANPPFLVGIQKTSFVSLEYHVRFWVNPDQIISSSYLFSQQLVNAFKKEGITICLEKNH